MSLEGTVEAENLSNDLWRERDVLDNLLYKFTTQRLLVSNGESRWLGRCTAEIETLKDQLATTQLAVDVHSAALAEKWGLHTGAAPTLRELVEAAPVDGPWAEMLGDHHANILRIAESIRSTSEENLRILKVANISLQDGGQAPTPVTYTATGAAAHHSGAALVDRAG
ncbi:hypothetical protein LG293_16765 (plasmid) [Citricoccus nitrophenolicus]